MQDWFFEFIGIIQNRKLNFKSKNKHIQKDFLIKCREKGFDFFYFLLNKKAF